MIGEARGRMMDGRLERSKLMLSLKKLGGCQIVRETRFASQDFVVSCGH